MSRTTVFNRLQDRSELTNSVEAPRNFLDSAVALQSDTVCNAMTVDVEDYFQVSAFDNIVSREDWKEIPSRIPRNIDRILECFDDSGTRATFFTLGWVADNLPEVVKRIVNEGHEIASHSYSHQRVHTLSPAEFRADVERTKKSLEDVSGQRVIGYRAPSFSIGETSLWAHDLLLETGYKYSSSVYPISHDHYGLPMAPRHAFRTSVNGILEIPLTTVRFWRRNWPGAGGGYFRLLPFQYSRWVIQKTNVVERLPAVFYFHPWEMDPEQPRVSNVSRKTKFRHYVNLHRFERRLRRLLGSFQWSRMDLVFGPAI